MAKKNTTEVSKEVVSKPKSTTRKTTAKDGSKTSKPRAKSSSEKTKKEQEFNAFFERLHRLHQGSEDVRQAQNALVDSDVDNILVAMESFRQSAWAAEHAGQIAILIEKLTARNQYIVHKMLRRAKRQQKQ